MAATDKRQLIVEHIKATLTTIRTSAGYYTNIGAKVTEGKTNPFDSDRVDGVDMIDTNDVIVTTTESEEIENHSIEITIRTIAKSPLTPEVARKQIADVRKAMKALENDEWWMQNVTRWSNTSNTFEIEQAEVKIIGTELQFTIECNTLALEEN
ncbi:MAG: hypothetical protein H3C35_03700 [Bacteroidetes bacterium]|nr:hypothetical protein [Bacteroidota bacterium]